MEKIRIKLIIFATALLGTMSGFYAQAVGTPYIPEVQIPFSFLSGGTGDDAPQAVEPTSDGGYIVAGVSGSSATGDVTGTSHGGQDFWVVKYDSLGKIQWQKLYGGAGNDVAYCIKQTSDGGYLVGGSAGQNNGDVNSLQGGLTWVIKLTSTGVISWQNGFGTGTRIVRSIVETSDGFVMAGVADGQYGRLFWAGKLSLDGNTILWSNTYADGVNDAVFYDMAKADDGSGFILTGYTKNDNTSGGLPNVLVMKINPTGGLLWKKVYGGDSNELAYAVAPAPNGGCIIVSSSSSSANGDVTGTSHGFIDFWILNLDAAGNLTSQQLYGGQRNDTPFSVQQTSDGGFMVAGASASSASGNVTGTNHGGSDIWLLKLSSSGAIQWQRLYGGSGNDGSFPTITSSIAVKARQTPDGGYIVTATSKSSQSGDVTDKTNNPAGSTTINDYWLFKTDASGNIVSVPDVGQR